MSDSAYSDHPDLEFLDEEPTNPMQAIEELLNGAVSLGYSVSPPRDWHEGMPELTVEDEQIEEILEMLEP